MFSVSPRRELYWQSQSRLWERGRGRESWQRLGRSGVQGLGFAASHLGVAAQGLFWTPQWRGRVRHLCVASANCARWKSAANRLISSQASAISALLAKQPTNRRHVSRKSTGAGAERAAKRDKRLLPDAATKRLRPAQAWAGPERPQPRPPRAGGLSSAMEAWRGRSLPGRGWVAGKPS